VAENRRGGSGLTGGEVWRWPAAVTAAARERVAGRRNVGNKRVLELHQDLRNLLEQLAGDEHGREKLAPSGGGHGGGWFGWRAEGEQEGLNTLLRVTRVT
jgi:hypothetical protein